jgi:ABC-type antimicrobial peptide transport system permease subunit
MRSIGTSVLEIRIMVFLEVLIRVLVSISIGILFGCIASLVFAHQV